MPASYKKENICIFRAVLSFPGFVHKGDRSTIRKENHLGDSSMCMCVHTSIHIQCVCLLCLLCVCVYMDIIQFVRFSVMAQSTGSRIKSPVFLCQMCHSFISCVALEVTAPCLSFFTCKVGIIECLPRGYFEYEMN